MPHKLNEKQKRFAREYCVDLNATQAGIRAGYAPKTAGICCHKLLKNTKIAEYIRQNQLKRQEKTDITADWVVQKLREVVDACIVSKPDSANKALELLGKHLGMYIDRSELTNTHSGEIVFRSVRFDEPKQIPDGK